jgi:hypothetical protein
VRALAVSLVLAAGCSSSPGGAESVQWRFADGRGCFDAGAVIVEARTTASLSTSALATFRCPEGATPAAVSLDAPGGGTLYLDALTALGADLYHGELSLDAAPPGTGETRLVTLYAVAAQ